MDKEAFSRLYAPTQITKLNGKYFIVDCYHHRVIYSDSLIKNIKDWSVVDYQFSGCHTITSDGEIYVVDNTGANEIVVLDSNLKYKQKFIDSGIRPHHSIYDNATNGFCVISGVSQEIFCFRKQNNQLYQYYRKKLAFLGKAYVRSIKIIDGNMYFVCADGHIYVANYLDESYTLINTYNIPNEFGGLNDIEKIGNYYYISSSTDVNYNSNPKFIRTTDLNTLKDNVYEDIHNIVSFFPYFISQFDGKVWCTELGDLKSDIYSFSLNNDVISNTINEFSFNNNDIDVAIRNIFPL